MTVARPRLTTGVTLASAGILALSLVVAAPPDVNGARTEVRAVQFAAFALPPSASAGAILEKLISHQAQTVVPVTSVVDAAADITTAIVTTPRTFVRVEQPTGSPTHAIDDTAQSVIDRAMTSQQVNNAAAVPTTDLSWLVNLAALLPPSLQGVFFFFVAVPVFAVVIFVTSAVNVVLGALGLPLLPNVPDPPFGPAPPISTTLAPTVGTNPLLANPAAVEPHTAATTVEAASAAGTGRTDLSGRATADQTVAVTEQPTPTQEPVAVTSIADRLALMGTEAAEEKAAAATPTPTGAAQPSAERSAGASTPEPAKPARRPGTPRPVVRGPVGVSGQQLRGLLHRDEVDQPTSQTAREGDRAPAGPSPTGPSSGVSSSTGNPSGGGSADGDANNSE